MAREFKELSVNNIDRKKYESNYDRIFSKKSIKINTELNQADSKDLDELKLHIQKLEITIKIKQEEIDRLDKYIDKWITGESNEQS